MNRVEVIREAAPIKEVKISLTAAEVRAVIDSAVPAGGGTGHYMSWVRIPTDVVDSLEEALK